MCRHRARSLDGGVGRDDPGGPAGHRHVDRLVERLGREVRRELHQEWLAERPDPVDAGPEQPLERRAVLEIPEPRRVGRGEVHHQVVGPGVERVDGRQVVVDGPLVGGVLVLADVHPDDSPALPRQPRQALPAGRRALVVEAHPVDEGPVLGQPEEARPGVSRLGPGRDGSDLDVAEPERVEAADEHLALVEPRRHAERAVELEPHAPHAQGVVGPGTEHPARAPHGAQRPGGERVGPLRVEVEEQLSRGAPGHGFRSAERRGSPGRSGSPSRRAARPWRDRRRDG